MPADVASCSRDAFLQKDMNYGYHSPETMSGYMTLVGPGKHRQLVHVKVYRTSLEHFAIVYPPKKVCRPLGVLNLRNTCVEPLPSDVKQPGFVVRQRGFDTPMCLTFLSESAMELDDWIVAFTSRNSPTLHQSSLPIVEEDEEVWREGRVIVRNVLIFYHGFVARCELCIWCIYFISDSQESYFYFCTDYIYKCILKIPSIFVVYKKNIYICILVVALKVKCVFYIIYPSHVSNHEYSDSSHL